MKKDCQMKRYVYGYVYIPTHTYTLGLCSGTHTLTCTHIFTKVHTHTHTHALTHPHTLSHTHSQVHTHTHMYTYTRTHWPSAQLHKHTYPPVYVAEAYEEVSARS